MTANFGEMPSENTATIERLMRTNKNLREENARLKKDNKVLTDGTKEYHRQLKEKDNRIQILEAEKKSIERHRNALLGTDKEIRRELENASTEKDAAIAEVVRLPAYWERVTNEARVERDNQKARAEEAERTRDQWKEASRQDRMRAVEAERQRDMLLHYMQHGPWINNNQSLLDWFIAEHPGETWAKAKTATRIKE